MPIYEFNCTLCSTKLEYQLESKIAPGLGAIVKLKCVECGGKRIQRVMSSAPSMRMGQAIKRQRKTFDGFGWHDGLNMQFKGPKHYREYLKQEGLIEHGNEGPPQHKEAEAPPIDDETLKEFAKAGLKVSGREAAALKTGEYMKSAEFKADVAKLSQSD